VSISTPVHQEAALHVPLRNEPVQVRSAVRLAGLLDAAAAVVHEFGFERLTTAMVAERASASIGTVYRYFPDRIALLQALAARNLDRVLVGVTAEIESEDHSDWVTALSASFAVFVGAFRTEPGFRSIRGGDVLDIRPRPDSRTNNSVVAEKILTALVNRFQLPVNDRTSFIFECAIEASDALAARAFVFDPAGDQAFLEAGREIVYSLLVDHFGEPRVAKN
jgi:AcrR family transcriptional regulator